MWFKVDDRLHDHRKARKLRRSHGSKARDVAPFGLWVLAGSWAGANGTDGFVPTEVLEEWDDDATAMARRLVEADLWWRTEQDGEPGFGFHDWEDMNPATERPTPKDASDSGTFGNHVRWHVNKGQISPDCSHCDRGDSPPDIAPNRQPESAESPSGIAPVPTRPDPTPSPSAPADADDARGIDRFDEFWNTYDKKHGRKKAEQKYRLALKKRGVTPDLLIKAATSYVATQRAKGKHPEYTKDPVTWLNGEHWNDEPDNVTHLPRTDEHGQPLLPPLPSPTEWMSR